jgi:hypothetical protein
VVVRVSQLKLPSNQALVTTEGFVATFWWFVLIAWLHLMLPGKKMQGTKLKSGAQLTYKLNGGAQHQRTWGYGSVFMSTSATLGMPDIE